MEFLHAIFQRLPTFAILTVLTGFMKTIPLHEVHANLGAKIVPFAGFEMPVRYTSDLEEHHAIRNNVGVFDVSHMGEFTVKGPGALALIQKVSANDASTLYDGKIQ